MAVADGEDCGEKGVELEGEEVGAGVADGEGEEAVGDGERRSCSRVSLITGDVDAVEVREGGVDDGEFAVFLDDDQRGETVGVR